MAKPKVLTIIGPTASGKTDFAFHIAQTLKEKYKKDVEIISADSRQVYKHIPISTAQPPQEYLYKIKHHFIDELELNKEFNAGEFGKKGRAIIQKLLDENKIPLIAGGSGLYINSLIYGLFEIDDAVKETSDKERKNKIRNELNDKIEKEGTGKIFEELKRVDPITANEMNHITNRRLIRALEVFYLTGIPMSELRSEKIEINFEPEIIGLDWEREELYDRINSRVDCMIKNGLLKEIETLKDKGYNYSEYNSLNTVGVKEVFDFLDGKIDYDKMIELIKQNTRRFAKRQLTWFRRDGNIKWVKVKGNITDLNVA